MLDKQIEYLYLYLGLERPSPMGLAAIIFVMIGILAIVTLYFRLRIMIESHKIRRRLRNMHILTKNNN